MVIVRKYFMWAALATLSFACGPEGSQDQADEATIPEHTHTPVVPTEEGAVESPRVTKTGNIGDVDIRMEYSAPSVQGRNIWGGVVSFGTVWVAGPSAATSIEFSDDVKVEDTLVQAGKYGLYIIPGKEEWVVILNENWDQDLAGAYNETKDIARFAVAPERLEEPQEQFRYEIEPLGAENGQLLIMWEHVKVPLRLQAASASY